uniref:Uncharacterized protein n=1 Tax=Cacopsylla melanoneura TaxID=428564 RepID=A0A8D8RRC0_9HEMI
MTKWRTHRRQANFPLEGGEKKGRRRRRSMKRKRKKSRKRKRRRKRRRRRKKRLEKDEDIVFLHFLQDVLRNILCSILNHLFTLIEYEIEIYLVHLTWDSLNPLVFVFETYPRPVLPDENIKNPYAEGKKFPILPKKSLPPYSIQKTCTYILDC